jgi:hypothetical protein
MRLIENMTHSDNDSLQTLLQAYNSNSHQQQLGHPYPKSQANHTNNIPIHN